MDNTLTKESKSSSSVEILEDIVVDQIAAGEVVERPASVVKELVENSLDAKSTEIIVSVTSGGQDSISVQDNGHGMSKDDALRAIKRFGTSKIKSADDLLSISSMGFRGEALPSVASISIFTLETKVPESTEGTSIQIKGGVLESSQSRNVPEGCKIEAKDLFFNVPARKKFLKTERTELAYIKSTLTDIASAFFDVRFELLADGKSVVRFPAASSFFQRLEQIYNPVEEYLKIEEKAENFASGYNISGLLSKPNFALQNSNKLRLIVNNRTVRDKLLLSAVKEGFSHYLKPGKYPKGLIKLDIPPYDIDINVHPQKSEVRFRKSDAVFRIIARSIKKALSKETSSYQIRQSFTNDSSKAKQSSSDVSFYSSGGDLPQKIESDLVSSFTPNLNNQIQSEHNLVEETSSSFKSSSSLSEEDANLRLTQENFLSSNEASCNSVSLEEQKDNKRENNSIKLSSMRYVGQIFKCYLLFEKDDIFAILDMHAAHEIVTFVRLKEGLKTNSLATQNLLLPETIELPAKHLQSFKEKKDTFNSLGLDIEEFGESSLIVRGTPAILGSVNPKVLLQDIFSVEEWANISAPIEDALDKVLSRVACHGSIRSGKELNKEQAYALIDSLEQTTGSAFCPHGRPVVNYLDKKELEARFARI